MTITTVVAIWLGVALFLCFVLLPFLSAKEKISKHKVEDWGITFFMWPISLPAFIIVYMGVFILGGIVFAITVISGSLFSWMEKKFK